MIEKHHIYSLKDKMTLACPRDLDALRHVYCVVFYNLVSLSSMTFLWPFGAGMSENLNGLSEN